MSKTITLRPEQEVPDDIQFYLLAGGRGSGKTQAGASWAVSDQRDTLILTTEYSNVRSVIVEGESGLISTAGRTALNPLRPENLEHVNVSAFTDNLDGPRLYTTSLDERFTWALGNLNQAKIDIERVWIDEAQKMEKWQWDLLLESFPDAQYFLTFTPTDEKDELLSHLYLRADTLRHKYRLTSMSSFENMENLHSSFVERILGMYANTAIAQSQLYGTYRRNLYV